MRLINKIIFGVTALLVVLSAVAYFLLRGSLPQLDGELAANVTSPVSIARDALGVVTITASNRVDLAYATGYAHGQDRFFQMDLQRRMAAGELAALLGKAGVDYDKKLRRHNFRAVARATLAQATTEQRQLLEAYTAGVNAARKAMHVRPLEYLVLRSEPAPWLVEDCVLTAFAMYIDLNDSNAVHELERARVHATVPQAVFDFLYPRGGTWDAPLDRDNLEALQVPIPSADVLDLRKQKLAALTQVDMEEADYAGSNNWALAGHRSVNGGALLANDMHLDLRVPAIWYRARLIVRSDDQQVARDLMGITLPGLPLLVAGSNGHIAWGFTNTHGDFDDLVIVDNDPQNSNRYRVGDHFVDYGIRHEQIVVRGESPIEMEYRDTQWGPLIDATLDGKPLALSWTAHHAEATNFRQFDLETTNTVAAALDIANSAGIPAQNFMVADHEGHIGWTLIGKLPKRVGIDGQLPSCWGCMADAGWQGWLAPQEYPRLVDPAAGQLWSANARMLSDERAQLIGDEGMDRGARSKQIRKDLTAIRHAAPKDMLAIQLDDRAEFLTRWRDALVNLLDEAYLRGHAARRAAHDLAHKWSGRAAVDDAGYRVVRAFRATVQEDIYRGLISTTSARYPDAVFRPSARFEDSLWQIVTTQPPQLLNAGNENWDAQLLASLDRAMEKLKNECHSIDRKLNECTWGKRNTLSMNHPLAASLPLIGRLLNMPRVQLPGDSDMPRVQGPSFGASERFAVSPGREAEGYFHMPGGQSGHPLSPYFDAGHDAWVNGDATPFLPGSAQHALTLNPAN